MFCFAGDRWHWACTKWTSGNLVSSAILFWCSTLDLSKPFCIRFCGKPAVDTGGPKGELFRLFRQEMPKQSNPFVEEFEGSVVVHHLSAIELWLQDCRQNFGCNDTSRWFPTTMLCSCYSRLHHHLWWGSFNTWCKLCPGLVFKQLWSRNSVSVGISMKFITLSVFLWFHKILSNNPKWTG